MLCASTRAWLALACVLLLTLWSSSSQAAVDVSPEQDRKAARMFSPGTKLECLYSAKGEVECSDGFVYSAGSSVAIRDKGKSGGDGSEGASSSGNTKDPPGSAAFYVDMAVSLGLVLTAGLMSGLTMGLMSLDGMNLEILSKSGTPAEKEHAATIIPLVKRHHLLLVTLLLSNAAAMEALPIFLDRMVHPAAAIAISVTLVLFFGEVIPQAICSRWGLAIGANLSYLVWALIFVLFPVAYPISKALDFILGEHQSAFYRRAELKELVNIHKDAKNVDGAPLTKDEVLIIKGALDLKEKTVIDAMMPIDKVYTLDINDILDKDLMLRTLELGHSRIPITQGEGHILGYILVKHLIMLRPEDNTPVSSLEIRRLPVLPAVTPCYEVLNLFIKGRSHMAVILDATDRMTPIGIITLEDVIEEILDSPILDEDDLMSLDPGHQVSIVRNFRDAIKVKNDDENGFLQRSASERSNRPKPVPRSNIRARMINGELPDGAGVVGPGGRRMEHSESTPLLSTNGSVSESVLSDA